MKWGMPLLNLHFILKRQLFDVSIAKTFFFIQAMSHFIVSAMVKKKCGLCLFLH